MPNEFCILCGEETTIDINTHVDYRTGYVEGAGQLCIKCYNKGNDREHITIPKRFIHDYPNNMDLGSKVREFFYTTYK